MSTPVRIFISYSHKDLQYAQELITHLSGLRRSGLIHDFYDQKINPGEIWDETIKKHLNESDIVLFLLSSDFLASDYINDIEIEKTLLKHKEEKIKIVPVLVRSCDYTSSFFSPFQILPSNARPVKSLDWPDRDEAWNNVINGIKGIITQKPTIQNILELDSPVKNEKNKKSKGCTFQLIVSLCLIGISFFSILYLNNMRWGGEQGSKILSKSEDSFLTDITRNSSPQTGSDNSIVLDNSIRTNSGTIFKSDKGTNSGTIKSTRPFIDKSKDRDRVIILKNSKEKESPTVSTLPSSDPLSPPLVMPFDSVFLKELAINGACVTSFGLEPKLITNDSFRYPFFPRELYDTLSPSNKDLKILNGLLGRYFKSAPVTLFKINLPPGHIFIYTQVDTSGSITKALIQNTPGITNNQVDSILTEIKKITFTAGSDPSDGLLILSTHKIDKPAQ